LYESPTQHWDAVPKADLGGMDIIATTNNFDSNFYNVLDWEEISGDNLKDAMYNRNRAVESALNCTFSVIYGEGTGVLEKSVSAGSGDVDFAYNLVSQGGGLIQKAYLAPFDMLDNIDMTQPYWDQGAQKYLRILGKMCFGFVDFGFDHYDSLAVLFYNGKLVTDFQLEDPQELVLEDAWTIDKMSSQVATVRPSHRKERNPHARLPSLELDGSGEIRYRSGEIPLIEIPIDGTLGAGDLRVGVHDLIDVLAILQIL